MQEKEISVRDLLPGYHVERDGPDICLMDVEGRRVARLPGGMASEPGTGSEMWSPSEEPTAPGEEWQELCQTLLWLAYSHFVECEVLRERVEELGERVKRVEEERDTSDRIAEDLYQFFSRTARRVANRKRLSEEGISSE